MNSRRILWISRMHIQYLMSIQIMILNREIHKREIDKTTNMAKTVHKLKKNLQLSKNNKNT